MDSVIISSHCVYDEISQQYITCYYTNSRPTNPKVLSMVKFKSFPTVSTLGFKSPSCFYYFYVPRRGVLYTSRTFGNLVITLMQFGYESDYKLLKTLQQQESKVCLVLRPKLKFVV